VRKRTEKLSAYTDLQINFLPYYYQWEQWKRTKCRSPEPVL